MSLASLVRSGRRNWWLLAICGLAAAATTFAVTDRQTREYESTLRLAVGPAPSITRQTRIAQAVDSLNKRSLITTFAELVAGHRIRQEAVSDSGVSTSEAAKYDVEANALPEANVILLRVQGPSRETAEKLAAAIAARAGPFIQGFYRNFAVRQLDDPSTPTDPVTPRPARDVPLAAVGGVALGLFLGLLSDRLRERSRREWREAELDE